MQCIIQSDADGMQIYMKCDETLAESSSVVSVISLLMSPGGSYMGVMM